MCNAGLTLQNKTRVRQTILKAQFRGRFGCICGVLNHAGNSSAESFYFVVLVHIAAARVESTVEVEHEH